MNEEFPSPWLGLMEKVRGENEADAQKEAEIKAELILAALSPGPIPLSIPLPVLATKANAFALLPNSIQFVLLPWATQTPD